MLIRFSFRWVDCQLREIAVCPRTEEHLDKLLSSLPRTLDDTYERMLLAIPCAFQDYARQMFMLLCCAKRNLTIEELIYGMAVDLDSTESNSNDTDSKNATSDHIVSGDLVLNHYRPVAVFKEKRKLHDVDAVLEVCPGFIELYEFRNANREQTSWVRIAHFSVQEYLKSNRIKKREHVAHYHMQEQHMNTQATRICLTILDKFDTSAALEAEDLHMDAYEYPFVRQMENKFPWACYAAEYWSDHFRENREIPPEAVSAMLRSQPYALRLSSSYGGGYNPLQLATHYGLSSVVSVLLDEPTTDINEIKRDTTAFIVAVKSRNMKLARRFLDHGADANACDGDALEMAAFRGDMRMANLLLDHGAKVNVSPYRALESAARANHLEMARLLLDHGAEIDARDGIALKVAVRHHHFEMAKLLVEYGAQVNASNGAALEAAVEQNQVEMAKLFLGSGAEINASGGAALDVVVRRGHFEMAKLLLESGADAKLVQTYEGRTALWPAVTFRRLELVRLLLEYGAEVNHCNVYGKTILHEAALNGYEDVMQLLLEYGADANITNIEDRTALHQAAEFGDENIALLLLEEGADPTIVDYFGNTAQSLAAKRGYEDFVTLLSNVSLYSETQ